MLFENDWWYSNLIVKFIIVRSNNNPPIDSTNRIEAKTKGLHGVSTMEGPIYTGGCRGVKGILGKS